MGAAVRCASSRASLRRQVEALIPMVLQNPDTATGKSRLKRVLLIGESPDTTTSCRV